MSDLTITTAGITESKVTGGEFLSSEKKLNQMKIEFIDVTVTLSGSAHTLGYMMFHPQKIENALSVKGGKGVLQSISVIADESNVTGGFDLVITSSSDNTGMVAQNSTGTVAATSTTNAAISNKTCGFVTFNNMMDVGAVTIGCKNNIGMVVKAEDTSRDLYVWGIARSTNNYNGSDLVLRFGIMQD